jgi:uncharacterized protein
VVRGFALFGVLVANLIWTGPVLALPAAARDALPTAGVDAVAWILVEIFVSDKANTLFAFLFGVGFALQLERGARRGGDAVPRFARRLGILFLFGLLHNFLLWFGDILHLYAFTGLLLIPARRLSNRTLVIGGLLLALFSKPVFEYGKHALPGVHAHLESLVSAYSDESVAERQARLLSGRYGDVLRVNFEMTRDDWVGNGSVISWIGYALGRFLLGLWVGRNRFLEDAAAHRDAWRRLLRFALPVGLLLNGWRAAADALELELAGAAAVVSDLLVQFGALTLAAGYLAAIVGLFLDSPRWRARLGRLAPVGRMALTNYLSQSLLYLFALYGLGLGWIDDLGAAGVTALAVVFFAAQIALSRWWLDRFRFGPVEWLWRTLTYGVVPPFRR